MRQKELKSNFDGDEIDHINSSAPFPETNLTACKYISTYRSIHLLWGKIIFLNSKIAYHCHQHDALTCPYNTILKTQKEFRVGRGVCERGLTGSRYQARSE